MIKINLLGDDSVQDSTGILWAGGYAAGLVLFLVTCFFLNSSINASIAENTERESVLQAQLVELQKKTKEVRDLEKKRKELSSKLAVIARLKKNKIGPVRVMDDLNISIPERSWLTDVKETNGAFSIRGFALDNQTIAEFMRSLDSSDYFVNVDLVETKQATKLGAKIKQFVLQAQVNYAGKILLAEDDKKDSKKKG